MVEAICQEALLRKDYLQGQTVSTIYFGGGTPSLLSKEEFEKILSTLHTLFTVEKDIELTVEANPDDLTREKLIELITLGVNRLSIGIQSFIDYDLQFMNRAHNAEQAKKCVKLAQEVGITNISIDLIYGTPTLDDVDWVENIEQAVKMGVQHISPYALTVEPKTVLAHQIKTGKTAPVDDEKASRHFNILTKQLAKAGFEHYEISNFALPGFRSKHNSSYWSGQWYLGLGPSAHSYNGKSRQYNVANNARYIKEINEGTIPAEEEILSTADRYNEYIMTALRRIEGIDIDKLEADFGPRFVELCINESMQYIECNKLELKSNRLRLTAHGRFFADGIASSLFMVEE